MKAAVVDQPGGLDTILIREVDIPQPGPGQVLIKVSYCGCNWARLAPRPNVTAIRFSGTVWCAPRNEREVCLTFSRAPL